MDMPKEPVVDLELHEWLVRTGSFPKGERPEPYQEYVHDGAWRPGQRPVVSRAELIGFVPRQGESVLELGSQMGGFLQLAVLEGAAWVEGVEFDGDHYNASRSLLSPLGVRGQHVHVTHGDVTNDEMMQGVRARAPSGGIDHLLLLSMGKHIGGPEVITKLITMFHARHTYVETNAVTEGRACPYEAAVVALGGQRVGSTTDRSLRHVYRIDRV
jgi:hypothetical protein